MNVLFALLVGLLLGGVAGVLVGFWLASQSSADAVKRIVGEVIEENKQLKKAAQS